MRKNEQRKPRCWAGQTSAGLWPLRRSQFTANIKLKVETMNSERSKRGSQLNVNQGVLESMKAHFPKKKKLKKFLKCTHEAIGMNCRNNGSCEWKQTSWDRFHVWCSANLKVQLFFVFFSSLAGKKGQSVCSLNLWYQNYWAHWSLGFELEIRWWPHGVY